MNLSTQPENETLLTFPCAYPLKIMGKNHPSLLEEVELLFKKHVPDFDMACLITRSSKAGTYLSVSCTIQAHSKDQLDALYQDLTASEIVLMAL